MKFYCIQQQRTIKQQGHGVAWWFGRASSPRTLFTLLKCPSEKHWISSSFSGAGLHHFSAFHPLQMGQAWKIMVHIHLFFFFQQVLTASFAAFSFCSALYHSFWLSCTVTAGLQPNPLLAVTTAKRMPMARVCVLWSLPPLSWRLTGRQLIKLTWAFGYISWPICSLLHLPSYSWCPPCSLLFLLLHIQHLHRTHARHPCTAFMHNIADFHVLLFICFNLSLINLFQI